MRETIIKCDLCLKDITKEEYIPRIKVKSKPVNGWRMDTGFASNYAAHELCLECETAIVEKILSLRAKGSNFVIYKRGKKNGEIL